MKILNNPLGKYIFHSTMAALKIWDVCLVMMCLMPLMAMSESFAQNKTPGNPPNENDKIHITADRLVASQNSQMVTFTGKVKVTRGKMTIVSDSLNVFYTDPKQTSDKKVGKDSIDRIVASGNVNIEMEGKTATCDQAVYQTATQSLTLTGENSRIQSGDNYITGNTVTIYQETGQIIVDGNDTKRVNAVFQPDDKTMTTDFK